MNTLIDSECKTVHLFKCSAHLVQASFWVFVFVFVFFCLFRTTPAAYGSSQARDQIGATAARLCHSHSHMGLELCL